MEMHNRVRQGQGLIQKLVSDVIKEMYDRPYGIAYTGAMIENDGDWLKLYNTAKQEISRLGVSLNRWKRPEDFHMTICLGELPLHMKMRGDINSEVVLHVTHFGISDMAAAFKVTGFMSKNEIQHITVLFKKQPADSKNIVDWKPLQDPLDVTAIIREVPAQKP